MQADKKNRFWVCKPCLNKYRRERRKDPVVLERDRKTWRESKRRNGPKWAEARRARYRSLPPEEIKAKNKRRKLRLYGLDPSDYDRMLRSQNGLCAICGFGPEQAPLFIDHCHKTGKVRGLLCSVCNLAISRMDHDSNWVVLADNYLKGK